jgi:phenylpropionate dioxygenase-like ring-hydroxylating dioxygenase large terminal subunit
MLVTQQKVLRRLWYPVMPGSHLEQGPKPFTLLGERIVVWRDGDGRFSALEDRCCHRTAALSRGYYEGGALVCGYHGWTYDHTGKVVRIP